jgi:hypothetical protein
MDAAQFRANTELVAEAHKLMSSALFRSILLVLDVEAPHRKPVNSTAFSGIMVSNESLCAVQLGRISGWEECLKTLKLLSQPVTPPAPEAPQDYTAPLSEQPEETNA